MKKVFISHSNAEPDRTITRQLYEYLAAQKIDCWVDILLEAGKWNEQIGYAMQDSTVAILVASRNSLRSAEVMREVGYFLKEKKTVIPFVLDKEYYLHPDREAGQATYLLGANDLEGVFVEDWGLENALARLVYLLPDEIGKLENNAADFVYGDRIDILAGYKGSDTSVAVPDSVTEICKGAFQNNDELHKVIIPPSVKKIGVRAFAGCRNLAVITGMAGVEEIDASAFDGTLVVPSKDKSYLYNGVVFGQEDEDQDPVIPDGTRIVAVNAFRYNGGKKVVLPEGVEIICELAFADAVLLEEIVIPSTVKRIGNNAFRGCGRLNKVVFKGEIPLNAQNAFDNFDKIVKEN